MASWNPHFLRWIFYIPWKVKQATKVNNTQATCTQHAINPFNSHAQHKRQVLRVFSMSHIFPLQRPHLSEARGLVKPFETTPWNMVAFTTPGCVVMRICLQLWVFGVQPWKMTRVHRGSREPRVTFRGCPSTLKVSVQMLGPAVAQGRWMMAKHRNCNSKSKCDASGRLHWSWFHELGIVNRKVKVSQVMVELLQIQTSEFTRPSTAFSSKSKRRHATMSMTCQAPVTLNHVFQKINFNPQGWKSLISRGHPEKWAKNFTQTLHGDTRFTQPTTNDRIQRPDRPSFYPPTERALM